MGPEALAVLSAVVGQQTVSVWRWVGIALLALAGLAVLTAARKRGPEAAASVHTTPELLAQYQRLATRAERTAATDEEIAYQRAVLGSLKPLLARAIAAAPDPASRDALRAVDARTRDLRKTLQTAKGTALRGPERAAVAEAAAALGRALRTARAPMGEDT